MFLKNKKYLPRLLSLFIISLFILPLLTNAALVNCGGGNSQPPCDFKAFISMINGIINWIISIAGIIFAVSFIYGGFLYMTSGDNPGNKSKATKILWSTLKGFVIILISWLIVYTLLTTLTGSSTGTIFKFIK
jgi:hypothetical protein